MEGELGVWLRGSLLLPPFLPGVGGEVVDEAMGLVPPTALGRSLPGSWTGAPLTMESRVSAIIQYVFCICKAGERGRRTGTGYGCGWSVVR